MEIDGGGDESAAAAAGPSRGKKRPPSPSTPPSNGEDSSNSTTSDEDDGGWAVSDSGTDDKEEDEHQGKYPPFTIDDFPRVSSDHFKQTDALYEIPDIHCRGPSPISLFRAFKDPLVEKNRHWFGTLYKLDDESEININNKVGTIDCSDGCRCRPMNLLQFIDLKIAGYRHAQPGCAKIFGFFAARDQMEPLRNYVYRREIDNYEAVNVKWKTGIARLSLISPARGICMTSHVLFEFKLCIRTEDQPEDGPKNDLLIEGCTEFTDMFASQSYIETRRFYGEKCGLDLKFALLINAVEAKVDVEILRAPANGLNLNLYAKTSGFRDVIRLFRGVAESGCRMSSVVAVTRRSYLNLCIEGSPKDDGFSRNMWEGSFGSCYHGTVNEVVNLDAFTTISVKVTWKAVES